MEDELISHVGSINPYKLNLKVAEQIMISLWESRLMT